MNKICNDYIDLIQKNYKGYVDTLIIYGSNIYNVSSSDLDVCLIVNKNGARIKKRLISETINFHKLNKLKVDEEIPFDNKLIYTWNEITYTLNNNPFYQNEKYEIKDIEKTKEFLSSKEMKQRLLLNILTTDHVTIGKSVDKYEKKAFSLIVNTLIKYYNLNNPSYLEILDCMYKNKYTGSEGEMYLGYKRNHQQKEDFLIKKIKEVIK